MKFISRFKKNPEHQQRNLILLVGLGNPGPEYKNNRHNIGFMVVEEIAIRLGEKFSRVQSEALITKGFHEGHPIILAKPRTFMNLSGRAVASMMRFYKLPFENLLVIYDEVDLPSESIRFRSEGSSAGHKGMRSIIENLGTQSFSRLRIGIGRPPGRKSTPKHVLQNFSKDERIELPFTISRAADASLAFVNHGIEYAMNNYNQKPE